MAENEILLQAEGMVAGYGGSTILNGTSFTARRAEITGIIGPNGAGKSTLVKALTGLVGLRQGSVRFGGADVTRLRTDERIALGMAYVSQQRSCFPSMTVAENLRLGAYLVGDATTRKRRLDDVFGRFPELRVRAGERAGVLSGGQMRMLEIGRFMMMGPRLVILDEPSIGLAPALVKVVYDQVAQLRDEGVSFIIVEQNVNVLLAAADHVHVLEGGRNRFEGTPADLRSSDLLASLYLGATGKAPAPSGCQT